MSLTLAATLLMKAGHLSVDDCVAVGARVLSVLLLIVSVLE